MTRWMMTSLFLGALACGGSSSGDDDDDNTTAVNCTSQWECTNGVCECDDGTSCDDADDCDVACEVCT